MYGEINYGVKVLVIKDFGQDVWNRVLEKSALDDVKHFIRFKSYDDDVFFKLVTATAQVTGMSEAKVMEDFGSHFLTYAKSIGYDKILLALGEDLFTFIQNLDSLHALLSITYKELRPPSFKCERLDEKNITLHYFSSRYGLYPLVRGLVMAVSRELFQTKINCEVVKNTREVLSKTFQQYHVIFKITCMKPVDPTENKTIDTSDAAAFLERDQVSSAITAPLTVKIFREFFPFHILLDQNLKVMRVGEYLQKILKKDLQSGELTDIVNILQPKVKPNFDALLKSLKEIYIFELKGFNESWTGQENLVIKGQLFYLFERKEMIFMGSPTLSSVGEKTTKDEMLSGIPLHEVGEDVAMLNKLRVTEIGISLKLDKTIDDLKRVKVSLKKEKLKNDKFLYKMLPVCVADRLKEGNQVPAENFANSTMLFSDMPSVAGISDPIEIVSLLNQLYELFDSLTATYSVVKIQTYFKYMVVGGVPEVSNQHAELVASFALEIVDQALKIQSTATSSPIQIRVGIHSGPVVAGIVGQKLPRYCLFGETVDIASSMESQGEAGKVHCSYATYNILKDNADFTFEERGEIDVPGKERMITYFLTSGDKQKYKKEIAAVVSSEEDVDDEPAVKERNVNQSKKSAKSKTCGIL